MRNRLIHRHWAVKEQVVMTTARDDLRPLGVVIGALEHDLREEPG